MTTIDDALSALADPLRRRIVEILLSGPRRTNDLAEELAVSVPALSRHLRTLRRSGLVNRQDDETDGRARYHALKTEALSPVTAWLETARWTNALSDATDDPHLSEMYRRVGGFLDAFTDKNIGYFQKHLSDDALLIFPGAPAPFTKEETIASVPEHAAWGRYEVIGEGEVKLLAPGTCLLSYKAAVAHVGETAPRLVWITAIFHESEDTWQMSHLQWTASAEEHLGT